MNNFKYKDEDYIHYFYKITNNLNGKYYFGIHSISKDLNKTPLNDGYWGSGTEIRKEIKSVGRNNFTKEVIKIFETREELSSYEREHVTIKEVSDPNCYNRILGGYSSPKTRLGFVICVLSKDNEKIVKIPREDYYNNKDLFIPIGHKNDKLKKKPRIKRKSHHIKTQKIDNSDTKYSRRRCFVNKITLETVTIIGHSSDPADLYKIWFPVYFYDKVNNRFITKDYLKFVFEKTPNLNKLSKILKIGRKNLMKIINFYEKSENLVLEKLKRRPNSRTFNGKTYVNKNKESLLINREELEKYIALGYKVGRYNNLDFKELYDLYVRGNSLKKISKLYGRAPKSIKRILFNHNDVIFNKWFHKDLVKENIRLLVTEEMESDLIRNGWEIGKKIYKKET